jgi:putative methylase
MKKKALEIALQRIPGIASPKPELEQYNTPAPIAADVLYTAHSLGDIVEKKVIDLGCGTGIFALGAKLLGAVEVIGLDIDERMIEAARESAADMNLEVDFRVGDVGDFDEKCDCVVQNPPFGAQNKHADRPFLEKALELADVVYSLHLTKTNDFIEKFAQSYNAQITHRLRYDFEIKHTFSFHTKEKEYFDVTMYRLQKNEATK